MMATPVPGFNDVERVVDAAVDVAGDDSGLRGDVDEPGGRGGVGGGRVGRYGAGGLRVGFWSLRGRNEQGEQGENDCQKR